MCEIKIILKLAKTSVETLEFYKEWGKAVGGMLQGKGECNTAFSWLRIRAANICIASQGGTGGKQGRNNRERQKDKRLLRIFASPGGKQGRNNRERHLRDNELR